MPRHFAIAAAAFVLGLAANALCAAEMSVPGAALGSAALAETDSAPARDDAPSASGLHATAGNSGSSETARRHLHPDSASESRETSTRSGVGSDGAASSDSSKSRHRGGAWQALLPGVMK